MSTTTTAFGRRCRRTIIVATITALAATCLATTSAAAATLQGHVVSGTGASAMPLGGARVTLFQSTQVGACVEPTTRADLSGAFSLKLAAGRAQQYVVAKNGAHGVLVALLGDPASGQVTVNELTTIAAAYATAQLAANVKI
ncbi:MAG: hypothetical protein WCK20_07905, partial [Thermoleophilia bacterium]